MMRRCFAPRVAASAVLVALFSASSSFAQPAATSPRTPAPSVPNAQNTSAPSTSATATATAATSGGGPVTVKAPDAPAFPKKTDDAPADAKDPKGAKDGKDGQDAKDGKPAPKAPYAGPVRKAKDKRDAPDYSGKGDPADVGDVLLWIPRVIVSPVYFVSEFVIRRPLGALITAAEKADLPKTLYDIFAFGPDHKAGIAPTVLFDFGFRPSVGVLGWWDDAFVGGNNLAGHFSTWGTDWLAGSLVDRVHLSNRKTDWLTLQVNGLTRPDKTFFGLGPRSLQGDRSRYGISIVDAGGAIDWGFWRSSTLHAALGAQTVHFKTGGFGDDPTLDEQIIRGTFTTPPGYPHGYTDVYSRLSLALDSRKVESGDGSGFRVQMDGENDSNVATSPGAGWVKYGGTAAAFYDLNGRGRVVSLSATTLFADPLGDTQIPFTELVTLGGYGPMKGFYPGRLADRSAAVAELAYTWPIWLLFNGVVRGEVGNVFGAHLQGFDPSLFRMSGAIGFQTVGSPNSTLELLVGAGSETFEHGAQIDSFRLYVGTTRGF